MSVMVSFPKLYSTVKLTHLAFCQIAAGGIGAAALGKWTMKVGTRKAMTYGGTLYGLAFAVTAAGIQAHSLPLLYAGNCKPDTDHAMRSCIS